LVLTNIVGNYAVTMIKCYDYNDRKRMEFLIVDFLLLLTFSLDEEELGHASAISAIEG
jgi:hypothetical protein